MKLMKLFYSQKDYFFEKTFSKIEKKPPKFKNIYFARSSIEILIKINLEKSLKLNSLTNFFVKKWSFSERIS